MALVFNRDFDPRYGEAVQILPGVRRVTARNPSPFTFAGTNAYIVGTTDLTVIDPGPEDPAQTAAIIAAAGGARIGRILITHSHRDHVPGARALRVATGAPVFAASPRQPQTSGAGGMDASFDRDFAPDEVLEDGAVVDAQDHGLIAVATPGHTADHVAFALAGTPLLFSGDHVMAWSTTVVAPPDGSMSDYMASLDRLLGRDEDHYLSGHGPELRDARSFVRGLRTHRKMREGAILAELAKGERTVSELVAAIYRDLDPKLRGAAGLSTLAHLRDLAARGLVAGDGADELAARYGVCG